MTLRLVAGFDDFTATAGIDARIFSAGGWYWLQSFSLTPLVTTGRFNYGSCIGFNQGGPNPNSNQFVKLLGVRVNEGYFGFAYNYFPSFAVNYVTFFDAVTGAAALSLSFHPLGIIKVWRGYPVSGALLIVSAPGAFVQEQWFYCEVGAVIGSGGAGSVEVRINTQTVINMPTGNTDGTGTGLVDSISFGFFPGASGSAATLFFIDDMYFNDAAGSVNNTFLGNVRVKTQFSAGPGSATQFSIGGSAPAATNWQSVLNTLLDDSKYVFDPTVTQKDLYTVQAIVNSPTVHGVQISGAYRMDDSTQRIAHNVLKSGATTVEGADHYVNQTYTLYRDIFELNPDTGLGWTGTEVNGIEIGPKVAG